MADEQRCIGNRNLCGPKDGLYWLEVCRLLQKASTTCDREAARTPRTR